MRSVKRQGDQVVSFAATAESSEYPADFEEAIRQGHLSFANAAISDLESALEERERFVRLDRAAFGFLTVGDIESAFSAAKESLDLAARYKSSWNYGNAIHNGNAVLGLVALGRGEFERAKAYLRAASGTIGSPQLGSFGPNMRLAKALLKAGEFEAVSDYLECCSSFWKSGEDWLSVWKEKLARREIPHFPMHLYT
jgi:tetratricopeptide (TPR) repeat protein